MFEPSSPLCAGAGAHFALNGMAIFADAKHLFGDIEVCSYSWTCLQIRGVHQNRPIIADSSELSPEIFFRSPVFHSPDVSQCFAAQCHHEVQSSALR